VAKDVGGEAEAPMVEAAGIKELGSNSEVKRQVACARTVLHAPPPLPRC
jgi:hypothetical protein